MADKKTVEVPLDEKIGTGDAAITTVTLRRPNAGELRGLQISSIMQMDASSMMTLLPRISSPALSPEQVESMNPADFAELAGQTVGFFYSQKAKTALGMV